MVRPVLVLVALALAAVLGAVQVASSAAYGDLAVRPSFPAALHARIPGLLRPLLGGPRARAAAALHNGDAASAAALVAGLPDDRETADLRGRIAQARGDREAAVKGFVRAGDDVRASALIDALAESDPARALAEQTLLVAVLEGDPNAGEVAGQAFWRLGQLQAAQGYRLPARRPSFWRQAEASYERALQYAPNEETYLLAAAYQSLANGELDASRRFYARAAEVVPNSADAQAGLAWLAALVHDCAGARANLEHARALRAQGKSPAARDPIDDPIGGPALARCTT